MFKKVVLVSLVAFVLGLVGSIATLFMSIDKINAYVDRRRDELHVKEELLNSTDKIEKISIYRLPANAVVNIRKSANSNIKVDVDSRVGSNAYIAKIENNILSIRGNTDNEEVYPKSEDTEFYGYNQLNSAGDLFRMSVSAGKLSKFVLEQMVVDDIKIVKDGFGFHTESPIEYKNIHTYYSDEDAAKSVSVINVYTPNSVNIDLKGNTSDWSTYDKVNIEAGLIKDVVTSNSDDAINYIDYNGTIKNFVVDFKDGGNNYLFGGNSNVKKYIVDIEKLELIVPRYSRLSIEKSDYKIAKNVEVKISEVDSNLDTAYDEVQYDIYDLESHIFDRFMENINEALVRSYELELRDNPNSKVREEDYTVYSDDGDNYENYTKVEFYDEAIKKIKNDEDMKKYIELFKNDAIDYYKNVDDSYDDYAQNEIKRYDLSLTVADGFADRVKLNAPGKNVKLIVDNYNPELILSSENPLDFRYVLEGRVNISKLVTAEKINKYRGDLKKYVSDISGEASNENSTAPSVEITSKYIRIYDSKRNGNEEGY